VKFLIAWYKRPVTVATILGIILALSVVSILDVQLGPKGDSGRVSYSVIINHYGVDSLMIEKEITKPLEDAVGVIPGIEEMSSISEYGKCRLNVILSKGADKDEVYLLLRDAVDRVYARLPDSVQKPQIVSSSLEKKPVFIVAFTSERFTSEELSLFVEKEVKPCFERIDGTGEIEVGGGEIKEVHIQVKPERAAAMNISFSDIASFIQSQNVLLSVGTVKSFSTDYSITFLGRLKALDELKNLMLNIPEAGLVKLSEIADVSFGRREQESISRVDGEKRVVLYVQASGTSNMVTLSEELNKEAENWRKEGLEPEIILDRGKKIEESLLEVLSALGAGIVIVIIFLSVSSGHLRQVLLLSLLLPVVGLVTVAFLTVQQISLDQYVLAGLAVGIGMIIDAGIVLTESLKRRRILEFSGALSGSLSQTIPPLVSSTLTTLVVLIPLFFLGETVSGIKEVSVSVGLLMLFSLGLTILFIPSFFITGKKGIRARVSKPFLKVHQLWRVFYRILEFVLRRPVFFILIFMGLLGLSVFIIISLGKDLSGMSEPGSIFVHCEFASGETVESVDEKVDVLSGMIGRLNGIERVETISRRGNAEMVVRFDPNSVDRESLSGMIKEMGLQIPGAFIYIPETSSLQEKKLEVAILGDDNALLRELAGYSASVLEEESWVSQVVLHFKEGPPAWIFYVDHEKSFKSGILTSHIVNTLRWGIHGPVAIKWIEDNKEIDLRVMALRDKVSSIEEIEQLVVKLPEGGYQYLLGTGVFQLEEEEARIYRKNRQRCVYFTVHTEDLSLDEAINNLWEALHRIELPEGYAFDLDKNLMRLSEQYQLLWFTLLLALLLIYMILSSQSESLTSPIIICSIVPVSLAFPIIALYVTGRTITLPVIIGLIILSGMVVNNAILICDRVREKMHTHKKIIFPIMLSLRKRFRPLLLTSVTTILGTLPLLITQSKESGLLGSLAFIVFWGILGSVIASVFFLPAVIKLLPGMLKPFSSRGLYEG
jgi:multidrug efflux pump subunit AcrB